MIYVIILFGLSILLVGTVIVTKPDAVFGLIRNRTDSLQLQALAVVVRLILGTALLAYAANSRFPLILQLLGWLSIGAAIVLTIIGRARFRRLMEWALGFTSTFGRVAGIVVMVFGGFLIYAVV